MGLNEITLTEHFNLREFQCPCCRVVKIHSELLKRLEQLRLRWGVMVITSGYRCEAHNLEVGGVKDSRHTEGRAADIVVLRKDQPTFVKLALNSGFKKALPYGRRNFVHLAV